MLSVRGEARRSVAPDFVELHCSLTTVGSSPSDALQLLRTAQDLFIAELTRLGGTALTVDTGRALLTWSVSSVTTHDDHDFDKRTGHHGPTGRVRAIAGFEIVARDFDRLPELGQVLARAEQLRTHNISWGVDFDNPAWRAVRADAIAEAIVKGRDYASALGGSVLSVEHVADAGLLGGDALAAQRFGHAVRASGMDADTSTPVLDPVPVDLRAVVEVRLVATAAPISG
jgi:uncharacterized protein YggE